MGIESDECGTWRINFLFINSGLELQFKNYSIEDFLIF